VFVNTPLTLVWDEKYGRTMPEDLSGHLCIHACKQVHSKAMSNNLFQLQNAVHTAVKALQTLKCLFFLKVLHL